MTLHRQFGNYFQGTTAKALKQDIIPDKTDKKEDTNAISPLEVQKQTDWSNWFWSYRAKVCERVS